jgi:hypothetical protein
LGGALFRRGLCDRGGAAGLVGAPGTGTIAGLGLFCLALFAWPLIGLSLARPTVQAELFGAAPDPTVAATLGVLLAAQRTRWELLVIPLLWCAISSATLWTMQSPDALVMPAVALLAAILAGWKGRRVEQ